MTSKDFWWGVILLGCVIEPALRWVIKKAWLWFVHLSVVTARIWYSYLVAHHARKLAEAEEFLRDAAP